MSVARWHEPLRPAMMPTHRVAEGLGWLSVVVGLAEILAPRSLARLIGAGRATFVRSCGIREIVAGMGILAGRRTGFWLWARVAGDVLDLATLARMLGRDNPRRGAATAAFGSVLFVTLLDVYCAQMHREASDEHAWRR